MARNSAQGLCLQIYINRLADGPERSVQAVLKGSFSTASHHARQRMQYRTAHYWTCAGGTTTWQLHNGKLLRLHITLICYQWEGRMSSRAALRHPSRLQNKPLPMKLSIAVAEHIHRYNQASDATVYSDLSSFRWSGKSAEKMRRCSSRTQGYHTSWCWVAEPTGHRPGMRGAPDITSTIGAQLSKALTPSSDSV